MIREEHCQSGAPSDAKVLPSSGHRGRQHPFESPIAQIEPFETDRTARRERDDISSHVSAQQKGSEFPEVRHMSDKHKIVCQIFEPVIPYSGIIQGRQSVGLRDSLVIYRRKTLGYDPGRLFRPKLAAVQYLIYSHIVPVKMQTRLPDAMDSLFRELSIRVLVLFLCLAMSNEINQHVSSRPPLLPVSHRNALCRYFVCYFLT